MGPLFQVPRWETGEDLHRPAQRAPWVLQTSFSSLILCTACIVCKPRTRSIKEVSKKALVEDSQI